MRSVGIKTLKNKLSEYIRLVRSGETVLITDRDRVVAELIPPRETRSVLASDALLAQCVREGVLTPAACTRTPLPDAEPIMSLKEVLDQLSKTRSDR